LNGGSARRKATTYKGQHKNRINANTSMLLVGFEPKIPMFERAKTVHALDSTTTVIGRIYCDILRNCNTGFVTVRKRVNEMMHRR
jgi:hypothetical protein